MPTIWRLLSWLLAHPPDARVALFDISLGVEAQERIAQFKRVKPFKVGMTVEQTRAAAGVLEDMHVLLPERVSLIVQRRSKLINERVDGLFNPLSGMNNPPAI